MKIRILFFSVILILFTVSCVRNPRNTRVKPASVAAFLAANPNIKTALKFEKDEGQSGYATGGTLVERGWDEWSSEDQAAVQGVFDRAWTWLYETPDPLNNLGIEEHSDPITCENCATGLGSTPTSPPLTFVTATVAKQIFFAQVGHILAVEAGADLSWSMVNDSADTLHYSLNSRSIVQLYGTTGKYAVGQLNAFPNARIKHLGRGTPSVPRWTYAWLKSNNLIKSTRTETILAFLQWGRENLIHFYGAATYANMQDHWGFPGQPSVKSIILGTNPTSPYGFGHWTAGCHGTANLIKSVMRVVNIPVQPLVVCDHTQVYFPLEGKFLSHGDDLYHATVKAKTSKSVSELWISSQTHASWYGSNPDFYPYNGADQICINIGKAADDF